MPAQVERLDINARHLQLLRTNHTTYGCLPPVQYVKGLSAFPMPELRCVLFDTISDNLPLAKRSLHIPMC